MILDTLKWRDVLFFTGGKREMLFFLVFASVSFDAPGEVFLMNLVFFVCLFGLIITVLFRSFSF